MTLEELLKLPPWPHKTGIAGAFGAAGFAITQYLQPAPIPITDFQEREVPERAEFRLQDGQEAQLILEIHSIKGKKGQVELSLGNGIWPWRKVDRRVVDEGQQAILVVDSRRYLVKVTKIEDRKDNRDQATISLKPA